MKMTVPGGIYFLKIQTMRISGRLRGFSVDNVYRLLILKDKKFYLYTVKVGK